MSKWIIVLTTIMLTILGGCVAERGGKPTDRRQPTAERKPVMLSFESFGVEKAPQTVQSAFERNKENETALLLEDQGRTWVLITRGLKPTGGYSAQITGITLGSLPEGSDVLRVAFRYKDPAPDEFVTQVLTYPKELVLVKGLKKKPDKVEFIREGQ